MEFWVRSISTGIFEYVLSISRTSSFSTVRGRCGLCGWQEARPQGVQSTKNDSAAVPLQRHRIELPVDFEGDVQVHSMPASPHDRDVMLNKK